MMAAGPERDAVWTVAKVLLWATQDFKKRGLDTARLDAELLLGKVLGIDRVRLILDAAAPLGPAELERYRELIKRRRSGEPIAYILGQREFYGLVFDVDRRVLIPRPDTEALVEVALERTSERFMFGTALDLCTGSGCVALAFHAQRRTWLVTASDVSPEAIDVARRNAERLGLVWGMSFAVGDLDQPLPADARFDLITANAPYIPAEELALLEVGVRDYEPRLALLGGGDGLDLIRRIVALSPARLRQGGVLALEVSHDQAERVTGLLAQAGFQAIERRRDYGGHERVVSGIRPT
jgi:release factor glutamine methyltransferase